MAKVNTKILSFNITASGYYKVYYSDRQSDDHGINVERRL